MVYQQQLSLTETKFSSVLLGRNCSSSMTFNSNSARPIIHRWTAKPNGFNQCLEMYLRCSVYDSPKKWHSWLALAELLYNSSFHSALQCSPFMALYGYEPGLVHPVFHISQLKPFTPNYSPVYTTLPLLSDLSAIDLTPEAILDHRLVKKGNRAIAQVLVKWTRLPLRLQHGKISMCCAPVFLRVLLGVKQVLQWGEMSRWTVTARQRRDRLQLT